MTSKYEANAFENIDPGALRVVAGYVGAVAISALTAAIIMASRTGPENGMFVLWLIIGGGYIAAGGLPGFALVAYLARRHRWSGWLPFTIFGGLNALLAWQLVVLVYGHYMWPDNGLLYASVRAGVAGGVAYWWIAYHACRR